MLRLPADRTEIAAPKELEILVSCLSQAIRNHPEDQALRQLQIKTGKILRTDLDAWLPLGSRAAEDLYKEAVYLGRKICFRRREWDIFLWSLEQSIISSAAHKRNHPFPDKVEKKIRQLKEQYRKLADEEYTERQGRVLCGYCLQAISYDEAVADDPLTVHDHGLAYPTDKNLPIGHGWLCRSCLR